MPLNVFNKTIYLIYSLNNLCLLSLSHIKKFNHCHVNVIHMCIIAFFYFSTIACCPYLTSFSVCNCSHILWFLVTQCFVSICIKHHSCIWLGISLIPNIYIIMYYSWHVLYHTCFYLWIYRTLNKIKYHISYHMKYDGMGSACGINHD
jgi:hypothetical protein